MHKETWTFDEEEIKEMKKAFKVSSIRKALEYWVFQNYDIRHTNGMDYEVNPRKRKVTITEY